jgi:TetR/AcrR family acrAB operon transcriptional repressor
MQTDGLSPQSLPDVTGVSGTSPAERRRSAHVQDWESNLDDPLMGMPQPARNLVQAAKRIIIREGLPALTLNAVAREAGENKAMTAYYFGNKEGLIAAAHDSAVHDEYIGSKARFDTDDKEQRLAEIVQEMLRISALGDELRVAFELTPHALRHKALRKRLRQLYRWYAEVRLEWLRPWADSVELETLEGLLELLGAIIDGLAIQHMVSGESFDLNRPYRVLGDLLRIVLPQLEREGEQIDGTADPSRGS